MQEKIAQLKTDLFKALSHHTRIRILDLLSCYHPRRMATKELVPMVWMKNYVICRKNDNKY